MAVYEPSDDSYLIMKCIEGRAGYAALDMGTGSGILLSGLSGFKQIYASDISPESVKSAELFCKKNNIKAKIIQSCPAAHKVGLELSARKKS